MSLLENVAGKVLGLASESAAPSSNWGSIHPDLIAVLSQEGAAGLSVKALVKDGNIEQDFGWQSPFENVRMDSANPTLAAVAQSGLADDLSQKLMAHAESLGVGQGDVMQQIQSGLAGAASQAAGRTGMTKLNSRQIFAGQSPLKISMTLLFRAWEDPYGEVHKPFQTLLQMAYSAKLAENQLDFDSGALAAEIQTNGALSSQSAQEAVKALFPSEAPKPVILTYKGERYPPMVIESIGKPLDAPYSPMGDIWLEVPLTLSSVQALDYPDWQKAAAGTLGGMLSGMATEAVNKAVKLFG